MGFFFLPTNNAPLFVCLLAKLLILITNHIEKLDVLILILGIVNFALNMKTWVVSVRFV